MGSITVDGSRSGRGSQVAVCHACHSWRELRGTRSAALEAAADHAVRVHGWTGEANKLRERAAQQRDTPDNPG